MLYTLDFSNTAADEGLIKTHLYQVEKRGGFYKLIECDTPRDVYLELARKMKHYNDDQYIGFDGDKLPSGTILTHIK